MHPLQPQNYNLKAIRMAVFLLFFVSLAGCNKSGGNSAGENSASAVTQASLQASAQVSAQVSAQSNKIKKNLEDKLMQAVFGKKYRVGKGYAIAELDGTNYLTIPKGYKQLADGRMILVTNSGDYNEKEEPSFSHIDKGILSVFVLAKKGTRWQMKKRHEKIAELGTNGQFGDVEWVDLGKGKPGLVVHDGGTWQGHTNDFIHLFDLNADPLREMGGMAIYSSNDGACVEETDKCWEVNGKYRFVPDKNQSGYNDLVIDFSGEESTLSAKTGKRRVKKVIKGSARYHFDGKEYVLIAGENLVPGF